MPHGQEIYLFFYRFGTKGLLGIIICNIIMAIIIYKTLKILYENNINTYKNFLDKIFLENEKLSNITNIIINVFLCATFFIMISGFGTYLSQAFGMNQIIGSSILALISYIVFLRKIESFAKINNIVIPILITIILIIGIINIVNLKKIDNNIYLDKSYFWILQAILYASYNLVLVEPVLINLKQFLKNKKQILKISIGVGIIMTILATLEFLLLTNVDVNFKNLEMPLVYVVEKTFPRFTYLYGIIILIAIFTTAVSVGISFLNNISKNKKSFPQKAEILCISSVIISQISFSKLVEYLFPLFGFLGLLQMIFILKKK
ncbi:MAG: hypothetical protein ACLR4X_08385 [Clostridia bacterium]